MRTRTLAAWLGTAACLLSGADLRAQDALDAGEGRGLIRAAARLSATGGWALTDAALLVTDDGGATWADVAPDRGVADVRAVQFLDPARGFLVALDVTPRGTARLNLLVTDDGGRSWREAPVDVAELPEGRRWSDARAEFLDSRRGFVLGRLASSAGLSRGLLFATRDGGESWTRLPDPPAAAPFTFADARRGFQLTPDGEGLFATFDGGISWSRLELPGGDGGPWQHTLPSFSSPRDGLLARHAGGRVTTLVTRDGGRTWNRRGDEIVAAAPGDVAAVALRDGELRAAGAAGALTLLGADGRRITVGERGRADVRALSFADDGRGWALLAEGACDAQRCREATRLVALDADDRGPEGRALLTRHASGPGAPPEPDGATISTGYGFDKCAAATTSQMQTWKTSSPYVDANIYYGGSARACAQSNLNAAWVTAVFNQGWRLIPTWVGPQAPCSGYSNVFSSNATTARSQGLAEADAAVAAAAALGLTAGSPLYYDLENYTETNATCAAAVRAFVNAWSERVKAQGYVSGVYGVAHDAAHDWIPGVISNPPDAVWIAQWPCSGGTTCNWTPSVFGLSGLSDSYWASNQRLRQYWGNHTKTYGGVTFTIDSNYAQGPVAIAGSTGPYTFTCDNGQSCFTLSGPSQYWHTETSCGGSPVGQNGSVVWTYVNGTVTSNSARWTPTLNGAGSYTVSVFIPRCYGTSQQAKYKIVANGATYWATVNQNNIYDQWVTLGTYAFAASGTQYVELSDATGEAASTLRQLAFDAVKFSK